MKTFAFMKPGILHGEFSNKKITVTALGVFFTHQKMTVETSTVFGVSHNSLGD